MAQKKGGLSEYKMTQIKELFQFFDKDNNGYVSEKELKLGLQWDGNNPSDREFNNLLHDMGIGPGEKIYFKQFLKCVEKYYDDEDLDDKAEKKRLTNAFKIFDKNGDGFVDKKELKKVLTCIGDKLTEAEVTYMFNEADKNKDGKIQYSEFVTMFLKDVKPKTKK